MKKALFIDRDGTLVCEPDDFHVVSFSKLRFLPGVLTYLGRISAETDFEFVMVSNQDGLGTGSFCEDNFYAVHDFIIHLFESEGTRFSEICIDYSFEHENKPTRKPGIGMLTHYLDGGYDMKNSFVIGDRPTDIELAKNLGGKAIFIENPHFNISVSDQTVSLVAKTWREIYKFLKLPPRMIS